MKRLFLVLLFTIYSLLFTMDAADAVSPTPSPVPTKESAISELKERIASRVAQLKLVEKRGLVGEVTDISHSQITLSDVRNNIRIVDVDEFTKFSSPSANPPAGGFGISDITKGATLSVVGLYNKQSRHIMARFVDVTSLPTFVFGAVASIDKDNFTLTVVANNQETRVIDVATTTKTQSYTKDTGLVRSGFSKIEVGNRVVVVGFPEKKEKRKLLALRIVVFPQLSPNPKINLFLQPTLTPTPTAIPTPTQPIRRTTPTR